MSRKRTAFGAGGIAAAALVVGTVLLTVAAGHSPARAGVVGPAASNVIVDGTTDSVVNIDPANEYDYGSFTLDLPLFQGLYGFPHGATLEPVLATRCDASRDMKTWTCQIRKGVKFSDGTPMTSADIKWSFDRVVAIKGDQGIYTVLSNLQSVSVSGPYTVVFHLKTSQSTWPFILAMNCGYVVPKAKYPMDKILSNTDTHVGTGPYRLVKYTPNQQAVLEPNPYYWGPKPKNGGIIINYYAKSSTMKLAVDRGELDMAFRDFTPTEYQALRKAGGLVVHEGNGVVIRDITFNVKRPPFDKLAVRQAIAYLIPRQTIASRVYHGTVTPLYSTVPAGLPGHIDSFKTAFGGQPNLAKAKAVLRKAGVKTPLAIDLWWTPSHYGDASAEEYIEIQRALNGSGLFDVTLKSAEWSAYTSTLGKSYGAFQLGWFPDYPDAEDYVVPFYQTDNYTNNDYSSPKMDALIRKEQAARTTADRLAVIKQMQLLGAKDVAIIPYWQGKMIAVARKNVHGLDSTLDAAFYMRFWLLWKS